MKFKVNDLISFDGSKDKTKNVYYSGLRGEGETNPNFPNDRRITRILVTQPHSKFRVRELHPPHYICDKLWEIGDEEMPVLGGGVFIHEDEAIPYDKSFEGTVINKKKVI